MKLTALALALAAALPLSLPLTPAAALAAQAPAAQAQALNATRVWDLSALYATPAAWEAERRALLKELPQLEHLKGTLGASAEDLRKGLDEISAVRKRLYRLYVYASLRADENTQVTENQERNQLGGDAMNKFGEATSFVNAEVAALGSEKAQAFLAQDKGLAKHRYYIESAVRLAAHTLSPDQEALLAAAADPLQQPQAIYGLLANADLPWPSITIRGQQVTLDQGQYANYRSDADPAVRAQVFKAF
ncbi:MAG: hypothetical protein JO006_15015 [Paucibacter sp.]|nr:hypothetical protein [Roseateles sp.]